MSIHKNGLRAAYSAMIRLESFLVDDLGFSHALAAKIMRYIWKHRKEFMA